MTKKVAKAKEPIRIRFKELQNGNKSIYLDTYKDGKRSYEFLKLYLVPEKDKNARVQNKAVMRAAETIKARRVVEIVNASAGIVSKENTHTGTLLLDWMEHYRARKLETGQSSKHAMNVANLIYHLMAYRGNLQLSRIDTEYCRGFVSYLGSVEKRNGGKLAQSMQRLMFNILAGALNKAVRDGLMESNPILKLEREDKPKASESERAYLIIDEVQSLIDTECRADVKLPFLFACTCGLRLSDIRALKWSDITNDNGQRMVNILMHKTRRMAHLPLSDAALRWLPERGVSELVFRVPDSNTISLALRKWASDAGITKHVTFHVSRHTYATMILARGGDLYTLSKLLGHTQVATTAIYGKIIDERKTEVSNLLNGVFK